MASTSGSAYGNNVDGSEGSYLDWQLSSQSVSGNYSVINWQAGWRFSSSSCRGLRNGEAYINGSTVYYDHDSGDGVHGYSSGHDHRPKLQTASGQITVYHDSNGTKSFNASVTMTGWNGGPNLVSSSGSVWWALPDLATTPAAPTAIRFSNITSTSVVASFDDGSDGGIVIDQRQIAYGTSPNLSETQFFPTWSGSRTYTITGLTPGTKYYFWAVCHNSKGWGAWGPRSEATTLRVPYPPSVPVISSIKQLSVVASFTANANGGATITAYEIGYGTSSTGPTTTVSSTSPKTITGLKPGTKYYFWSRAQNSVGWSSWSASSNATTIAGARIKVGAVWKNAVPYVRVGGVWKVARPWSRTTGVWKESS